MASAFSNDPIEIGELPQLDDDAFHPLDRRYLRLSLTTMGVLAAVVTVAGAIVASQVGMPWIPLLIMGIVLSLMALAAALRWIDIRHIGYQVRTHDISFRRGVIKRSTSTLPFVRVQHARLNRGPLERKFGLATVHVNSAGPDLVIPGLPVDDAERIKALIMDRAALVEEA